MIIVIIIISNNSGPWWLCNLLILLCVQLTENLFLFSTIIQVETDAVKLTDCLAGTRSQQSKYSKPKKIPLTIFITVYRRTQVSYKAIHGIEVSTPPSYLLLLLMRRRVQISRRSKSCENQLPLIINLYIYRLLCSNTLLLLTTTLHYVIFLRTCYTYFTAKMHA